MSLPSLHRALYAFLSTYAPLTALIGTRIYPGVAPQETPFPYVTLHELHVGSHYHTEGASGTHDTLVQVDCWALAPLESKKLASLLRLALEGRPLVLDDLAIDGIFVDSEVDLPELAADGSERTFYRRSLTLSCWHERDVPLL